jgi:hypothetical protein
MWPLFFILQLLVSLTVLQVPIPANVIFVLEKVKGVIELNALPKKEIVATFEEDSNVAHIFSSGGMIGLLAIPIAILGIGLFFLFALCFKKCNCCKRVLKALK